MTHDTRFYEREVGARIRDFWWGNRRMEEALGWLLPQVEGRKRVLEIGCGIGWASFELASADPERRVFACDLSARQIETAERLLPHPAVERVAGRFPEVYDTETEGAVDAVVLLDVYEHIPAADRRVFDAAVGRALEKDGLVLLTCPTPRHQARLRTESPGALQPVDEDITREVLEEFADRIGGVVDRYEERSIWSAGDYLHARIARGGANSPGRASSSPDSMAAPRPVLSLAERRERVGDRLGVEPTQEGILMPRPEGRPGLTVATYNRVAPSETFIRDQIEGLPFRTRILYGTPVPTRLDDDRSVLPVVVRGAERIAGGVLGRARAHGGLLRRIPEGLLDGWLAAGLRRAEAQVLLAQYGPVGAVLSGAAQRAGIPMVVHFHGFDAHRREVVRENADGYRRMWDRGAWTIVVSEPMRQVVVALGAPPDRVELIPCGVRTASLPEARPDTAPPEVLAVGRLMPKKDPLSTLRAFARARTVVAEATLTLAGDGPLRAEVEAEVARLGLEDAVHLPGALPHGEVLERMSAARLFVQHSREAPDGDSEGSPVSIVEASGCGLPIVSTRHAGIPAAVVEGRSGYLVEEGDVEGMASRMVELLADPDAALRMGRAGRDHVRTHYDQRDQFARITRVLERAIDDATSRGA